ncbi:glycosyltransferase family 4 protein [Patescibacteria group bacterium]
MKIAQIVCQFRPYKSGISESAYYFSKELAKRGNEVVVFTPLYDKKLQTTEEMDGFKIKRIKPFFSYGNGAFIPKIKKELNGFDIVHLHYPFFGAAEIVCRMKKRKLKSTPLIITYHMDVVGKGILKSIFNFHTKNLMPKILKSANKITFSSLDYYKNSNAKNIKLNEKNIIELPFGIDQSDYKIIGKDNKIMDKYNLEYDDKIILMIGGIDKAHYFKGLEYLFKALKIIKETYTGTEIYKIKIIIIGGGNMKKYYINLAGQLGISKQIIFAGKVSDEEKIKLINSSYINVLPSIDKSEVFGISLIEAMACAKPVIASNLAGVRTVVEDGVNGLLCEPKNANNLAGKIKYLLDNPLIARQMGGAGLEKVQKIYNWKNIGNRLEKIYKNLI